MWERRANNKGLSQALNHHALEESCGKHADPIGPAGGKAEKNRWHLVQMFTLLVCPFPHENAPFRKRK
jgi:hypothetical protein